MTHRLSRRSLLQRAGSGAVAAAFINGGQWSPAIAQTAVSGSDTWKNSVGMEFLTIPAGRFMMGSPETDIEAPDFEKPQHQVTISRPFMLGRIEVTQANWEALLGENPYERDRSNPYYSLPGMAKRITRPSHPATVSWNDAQDFISALNAKEGGSIYRLPTEAEWEYAARAGTTTRYSFGDDKRDLERHAWYGGDFQTGGHHPVGTKEPNQWGLHDMHGNVWEWVSDWHDPNYYARSAAVDPRGPESGTERVVRGGSWHTTATSWRSAFRRDYKPDYRGISIGFRLVREIA
jgi:formylglycine-generating enzyme required for sulfatase activity